MIIQYTYITVTSSGVSGMLTNCRLVQRITVPSHRHLLGHPSTAATFVEKNTVIHRRHTNTDIKPALVAILLFYPRITRSLDSWGLIQIHTQTLDPNWNHISGKTERTATETWVSRPLLFADFFAPQETAEGEQPGRGYELSPQKTTIKWENNYPGLPRRREDKTATVELIVNYDFIRSLLCTQGQNRP